MYDSYRAFFGLQREPFATDLQLKEILETRELQEVKARFDYALRLGGLALVTGEIGSGKSTALRYAAGHLHPSEYQVFYVTASSGSILELYRQVMAELGIERSSTSRAVMTGLIRKQIIELVESKKMKAVLVIDEASLLRLEVFAELHTLGQFRQDSKPWLPIILAGQGNLIDKLMYRASGPLASRIVARSHLEGLDQAGMKQYLEHHLRLAGIKTSFFDPAAVTAIHQGSGGLLRKANHLARGALIAAANSNSMSVIAEHVRLASTELF
ncbi:MAG: AAA family ATPase [Deltaproteobacteria bacterium]|nr:AAA family ATPase [Deltaproteobacteria bacterium]